MKQFNKNIKKTCNNDSHCECGCDCSCGNDHK